MRFEQFFGHNEGLAPNVDYLHHLSHYPALTYTVN